jgi:hypothetical protein
LAGPHIFGKTAIGQGAGDAMGDEILMIPGAILQCVETHLCVNNHKNLIRICVHLRP